MNVPINPSPQLVAKLTEALMNAGMGINDLETFAGNPEILETTVRMVQESNSLQVDYGTPLPFEMEVSPPRNGVVLIPVSSIRLKRMKELTDEYSCGKGARVGDVRELLRRKAMTGADAWYGEAILTQPEKLPRVLSEAASEYPILLPGTLMKRGENLWMRCMTYSSRNGWVAAKIREDKGLDPRTLVMVLED